MSDIPQGDVMDNDYKSRTGQSEIPVQSDDKPIEDPINADTADSDEQLGGASPPKVYTQLKNRSQRRQRGH